MIRWTASLVTRSARASESWSPTASPGWLPADDGTVDAVVASLVPRTVADQTGPLAGTRRVLRPGRDLRFYEHVRAIEPRLVRSHVLGVAEWEPISQPRCSEVNRRRLAGESLDLPARGKV